MPLSERQIHARLAMFGRRLDTYDQAHEELVLIGSKYPEEYDEIEEAYDEAAANLKQYVESLLRKLP